MKNKKMIGIIIAVLAIIVVAIVLIVGANKSSGPLEFTLNSDGESYSVRLNAKLDKSQITEIEIPSTYKNKPVTTIYSFSDCTSLTKVVIPDSVTTVIGGGAFSRCTSLTSVGPVGSGASVELPSSLTSIPSNMFTQCTSINSVVLPDSITFIDSYAFQGCTSLTDVTISNSVTEINSGAFSGCSSLKEIVIPDSVITIQNEVFSDCTALADIKLSNQLVKLGSDVFENCSALTTVTIPASVEEMQNSLNDCDSLTTLVFEGNPSYYYYRGLSNLTTLVFKEGVTEIPDDYFRECKKLATVTLPDSLLTIGYNAFSKCESLKTINLSDNSQLQHIGTNAFFNCSNLQYFTIPDTVTSVGAGAFQGCNDAFFDYYDGGIYIGDYRILVGTSNENISSLRVHSKTEVIATFAVYGCESLKSINLGSTQYISDQAFDGANRLESLTMSADVKYIGHAITNNSQPCINFGGTQEQWNAIEKHDEWNNKMSIRIICSDGDIIVK